MVAPLDERFLHATCFKLALLVSRLHLPDTCSLAEYDSQLNAGKQQKTKQKKTSKDLFPSLQQSLAQGCRSRGPRFCFLGYSALRR